MRYGPRQPLNRGSNKLVPTIYEEIYLLYSNSILWGSGGTDLQGTEVHADFIVQGDMLCIVSGRRAYGALKLGQECFDLFLDFCCTLVNGLVVS